MSDAAIQDAYLTRLLQALSAALKEGPQLDPTNSDAPVSTKSLAESAPNAWVAYSGGADSHLLLYGLAKLFHSGQLKQLCGALAVIHVNHQLMPESDHWQQHCMQQAEQLDLPIQCVKVQVQPRGEGLESAAREARYQAFYTWVQPGERLFLAHHGDDQVETLLYRFARGTGVEGLVGLRPMRIDHGRHLLRPLLGFSAEEIRTLAHSFGLRWIEDPSNEQTCMDRNYLRHQVIPRLKQRWPGLLGAAGRLSEHSRAAASLLQAQAARDVLRCQPCPGPPPAKPSERSSDRLKQVASWLPHQPPFEPLNGDRLAQLPQERLENALRYWLKQQVAAVPGYQLLKSVQTDLLVAKNDKNPSLQWENHYITRYNRHLYCVPKAHFVTRNLGDPNGLAWNPMETPTIHWHAWTLTAAIEQPLKQSLEKTFSRQTDPNQIRLPLNRLRWPIWVAGRSGGEAIKPIGTTVTRPVKKLLQESGCPPWLRDQLPFFYQSVDPFQDSGTLGDTCDAQPSNRALIAVADRWQSDAWQVSSGEPVLTLSMTLR